MGFYHNNYTNYWGSRREYWLKDDIADSINYSGNFTLTKEEKKRKLKNPYNISNYKEIRNIIDFIAEKELKELQNTNLIDDYMWFDNYEHQYNVDLKILIKQMTELKNSILKLKIKIKNYKKYELEFKYRKKT